MPTYRANIGLTWNGQGSPGVNTWHFRVSDDIGPGETSVQEVVDALKAFYTSSIGMFSNDVVISCPSSVIKDPYGSPEFENVTPWSLTGQGGGPKAPAATALTVTWRTASATRAGRGRTFLSPIPLAACQDDGTPATTPRAAVQSAATALVNKSKGWTFGALGVYSKEQGVLRDFQSANVRDVFAVLRSRRD